MASTAFASMFGAVIGAQSGGICTQDKQQNLKRHGAQHDYPHDACACSHAHTAAQIPPYLSMP